MMLFKIDENLPVEIAAILTEAGHDALTVYDQRMNGISDRDLAAICRNENRILVSFDIGFADIRTYPPTNFPGIIIMRLFRQDKGYLINVFKRILSFLNTQEITGRLWIVDEKHIRIRR